MQSELPELSRSGWQEIVAGAGHYIQLDRPEAVVSGIEEVVAAVRERQATNR